MNAYAGIKKLVFFSMLLVLPVLAYSMGNTEQEDVYRHELSSLFNDTVTKIENSEITLSEGKDKFKKLRARYNMGYTDEAGVIDSMLDRVYEGTLTLKETKYYFNLMQEHRLSDYRTESYQKQLKIHQQELLALIQSMTVADSSGISVPDIRNTMNNYYNFFGLRYGQEYRNVNQLLILFEEGKISVESLRSRLAMMENELNDAGPVTASVAGRAEQGSTDASGSSGNSGGNSSSGDNSSGTDTGNSGNSGGKKSSGR